MIREPKILTYLAVAGIDCSNYFVEEMVEAAVAAVEHALVAVVVAASSFVVVAAAAAGASFEIGETFPEVEYSYWGFCRESIPKKSKVNQSLSPKSLR